MKDLRPVITYKGHRPDQQSLRNVRNLQLEEIIKTEISSIYPDMNLR